MRYKDGDSIGMFLKSMALVVNVTISKLDWIDEEDRERTRLSLMNSQYGLKRVSLLAWDTTRAWLILIGGY